VANSPLQGKLELKYDNSLTIRKIGLDGADLIFASQPVTLNVWTHYLIKIDIFKRLVGYYIDGVLKEEQGFDIVPNWDSSWNLYIGNYKDN
jgi:hypothetical protein